MRAEMLSCQEKPSWDVCSRKKQDCPRCILLLALGPSIRHVSSCCTASACLWRSTPLSSHLGLQVLMRTLAPTRTRTHTECCVNYKCLPTTKIYIPFPSGKANAVLPKEKRKHKGENIWNEYQSTNHQMSETQMSTPFLIHSQREKRWPTYKKQK